MRAVAFLIFFAHINFCLAYDNQWIPNYYQPQSMQFNLLRMVRGSCVISLNIYRRQHFNVKIPLFNETVPAGFCAILLNGVENYNLAIALEQDFDGITYNVFNQNIRLYSIKSGNVTLVQNDCDYNNAPLLSITNSNIALLFIKADQNINIAISVYTHHSFKNSCVHVHLLVVYIIFCVLYDSTAELNYRRPKSHFQLTPCQSAFTINTGNYIFDYDAKITGNYDKECTFLIESPPTSQMRLNVSLSIGNLETIETCASWLKFFDFHSNATLVLLAEYCESTNITDLLTYSNIMYISLNIPPEGLFQLHIET